MEAHAFRCPDVEAIRNIAVERFGGFQGTRDKNLPESVLAQSVRTFGGTELYPEVTSKAARYAWAAENTD